MFIEMMSNKLEKNLRHSFKFYNYQFDFFFYYVIITLLYICYQFPTFSILCFVNYIEPPSYTVSLPFYYILL